MSKRNTGKDLKAEKQADLDAFKEQMSDIEAMCPESAIAVS